MHSRSTAPVRGSQDTTPPQLAQPSARAWTRLRIVRYLILLWPALFLPASSTPAVKAPLILRVVRPTSGSPGIDRTSATQNVQYQTSLLRDNLPDYLDFVGRKVLPVMSQNIDKILHDLHGLTDIKPGLFYHEHIDYSTSLSGGMDALMDMNNVILQYHTLENPILYIPYWREELRKTGDRDINAWLDRVDEYNQALRIPSAASEARYVPLTESEVLRIASSWDDYRSQIGLASPGLAMLANMVYVIDGGRQPHYQESFRNIYRFHSIAFHSEGYISLEDRTHLENTFSPFQIEFESIGECRELLPVFAAASAAGFGYILNLNNKYMAAQPQLMHDPDMRKLSLRLKVAMGNLPDNSLIKINTTPDNQQIAFFAAGNYIFVVYGSLDSPSLF